MNNWLVAENIIAIAALLTAATVIIIATIKTSKFIKSDVGKFTCFSGTLGSSFFL